MMQWALNPMTSDLLRDVQRRQRGGGNATMEAEIE